MNVSLLCLNLPSCCALLSDKVSAELVARSLWQGLKQARKVTGEGCADALLSVSTRRLCCLRPRHNGSCKPLNLNLHTWLRASGGGERYPGREDRAKGFR